MEPTDAEGETHLVSVAHASGRAEAEMIQGLLESAGIPSVLQHVGVDGPLVGIGILNPGGTPRQVMVRAGQSKQARALLSETFAEDESEDWHEIADALHPEESAGRQPRSYGLVGAYARIWVWSLAAMGLAFAVFILLRTV